MLVNAIVKDWVLTVALLLLAVSSIYLKRIPEYRAEDFKILFTLWVFLLIVKGLSLSGFFRKLALHLEQGNFVSLKLVIFSFFLSMFVTNDIALFIVVPITLLLKLSHLEKLLTVIGETIAVNIGSAIMPFGNPQNIYLYFHFKYSFGEFIKAIYPFILLLFPLIIPFFVLGVRTKPIKVEKYSVDLTRCCVYLLFLAPFTFTLLGFLPLFLGLLIPFYVLLFDRITLKVDYGLLITFFAFFGFSNNLSFYLKEFPLKSEQAIFFVSTLGSQMFSNVPTALVLGGLIKPAFKNALLWGVNAGGFGTLVGSMANLIAFRLYTNVEGNKKIAFFLFHLVGFIFLILAIAIWKLVKSIQIVVSVVNF